MFSAVERTTWIFPLNILLDAAGLDLRAALSIVFLATLNNTIAMQLGNSFFADSKLY